MSPRTTFSTIAVPAFNIHLDSEMDQSRMQQPSQSRMPSQSVPTTNHNSPTHASVPKLNLAHAHHHIERPLVKSKSMPGTSRELPQPTKFTFSSHDVTTMSKMTDNTSQIPHWREFPKPPIRILCRVELKAKLKLDTYKATSHSQQISPQYHKSSHIPMKSHSVFEPSPEQQYYQSYYSQQQGYDSQDESDDEGDEEYDETSSEDEDGDENRPENYAYTYHAPIQQSQQPSSKHFTFPTQQPQQSQSQHQYIQRPPQQQQQHYDYQKPTPARMVPQSRPSVSVEEKKRIINRSPVKSVPMKPTPSTSSSSQVVFTIHPHHHKYSQPDQKRASFSQPTPAPAPLPQHQRQRSESSLQQHIRRHRSAPSIESTPPKHLIRKPTPQYHDYQYDQVQQSASAYELARTLWRKQRRSYQDMLTTLHSKLHISGSPQYHSNVPQFVSP